MTLDVTTRKAMETKNVELRAEVAEAETAVDCATAELEDAKRMAARYLAESRALKATLANIHKIRPRHPTHN